MTRGEDYVLLCGADAEMRDRIQTAALECRTAKNDREKRRKASQNLRTVVDFFAASGRITEEQADGLFHALYLDKGVYI